MPSPRPPEKVPANVAESHVQDLLRWAEARPPCLDAIAERWDEIQPDHPLTVAVWDTLKRRDPELARIVREAVATLRPSLAAREGKQAKTRRAQRESQ